MSYFNYFYKGICKAENLIVSSPSETNKKVWRDIGAAVTTDNSRFKAMAIMTLNTMFMMFKCALNNLALCLSIFQMTCFVILK